MFSSEFISDLTFRSSIHFVCGVRKCSDFSLLQVTVQFSQHHLMKRLSLPHCIFLPPLSKIRSPCVCTNEVDEPTAYYTVKSESENQILHIDPHIWNLERRY